MCKFHGDKCIYKFCIKQLYHGLLYCTECKIVHSGKSGSNSDVPSP